MDIRTTLSGDLRSALRRHGLTADDIDALLRDESFAPTLAKRGFSADELREYVQSVIAEDATPSDTRRFAVLLEVLNETADLAITGIDRLRWYVIPLRVVRALFAILFLLLVLYMLIGGLVATYPDNWGIRLTEFAGLLLLLGVFEGLQICVATLRLKDLHGMRQEFSRAERLHRLYSREEWTRRFYAGRQFFVVIIVFLSAYLTSVDSPVQFPLINRPIPEWFRGSIGRALWDLGMAGALVTLWFGQLAPQFVANRVPVRFSNVPGMGFAIRLALFLDMLGITRPGTWLSQLFDRHTERIPSSTREAYRQYVDDLHGYGIIGMKKEWIVSSKKTTLSYHVTATINRRGLDTLTDDGLFLNGMGFTPRFKGHIIDKNDKERDLVFESTSSEKEGGITQFCQVVTPRHGSFQIGDILTLRTDVDCKSSETTRDIIVIARPTKYIVLRVVFEEEPLLLGRIVVIKSLLDPVRGEFIRGTDHDLTIRCADDKRIAEFIDFYPELNARYELQWTHDY